MALEQGTRNILYKKKHFERECESKRGGRVLCTRTRVAFSEAGLGWVEAVVARTRVVRVRYSLQAVEGVYGRLRQDVLTR